MELKLSARVLSPVSLLSSNEYALLYNYNSCCCPPKCSHICLHRSTHPCVVGMLKLLPALTEAAKCLRPAWAHHRDQVSTCSCRSRWSMRWWRDSHIYKRSFYCPSRSEPVCRIHINHSPSSVSRREFSDLLYNDTPGYCSAPCKTVARNASKPWTSCFVVYPFAVCSLIELTHPKRTCQL